MNISRIKATFTLLFLTLFLSQSVVFAQTGKKITINNDKITIGEALASVEKQTEMSVAYNESALGAGSVISLNINNESIEKTLDAILKGTGFTWTIEDGYIIISPVKKAVEPKTVSGTVLDENGLPMIGVGVIVSGGTGTITDMDGKFSISAKPGDVIQFSCLGYVSQSVKVSAQSVYEVKLLPDTELLDEVVVTALGIKRAEKALSYNVQQIDKEKLTTVKSANFMNSLAGKVAGVNINASSAGIGGATKVVMRGPKSLNQSNQALYVIDGVPVNNRNGGELTGGIYAQQPGSEGIADLNPDDIESISVLSGPAAAALYGSAAAQGVIMITTKKGVAGKVSVSISNSTQFSDPLIMPEFQNEYANRPGEFMSWGEKGGSRYAGYEPEKFFNTAANIQNNVALTVGNSWNQTYVSVGTTNANGIIPNNSYERYNFTVRNSTSFLNDKLNFDFGFNYIKQKDCNLMAQGQYFNPLVALYLFPRGESFDAIRTFELYDQARGIYVQNWNYGDALNMQNPYWVAKRMNRTNNKDRYMVNASLKYDILDWLNIVGRVRYDRTMTKFEDKRYASTINLFAHSDYGFYKYYNMTDQNLYADFMLNINKTLGDFSIGANIGVSTSLTRFIQEGFQGGLKAPSNIFTPNAIDYGSPTNDNRPIYDGNGHIINAAFGNIELGWKSMLYLTVTGRNDWDSALHGTNHESFFYPSVGLSGIISNMVRMPQFINYLKVRGSWASVGSAIAPNITSGWRYEYNAASQSYKTVTYKFPKTFYPERTNSYEVGVTGRFFNSTLSIDATYYRSNTYNQTFLRDITGAAGYDKEYVQTGNVRNQGLELAVGYSNSWGGFSWDSNFTYSFNRNKIIELMGDNPDEVIRKGGLSGAEIILKQGGTMGDIYSYSDFKLDRNGNIALDASGNVIRETLSNPKYCGSVLPKGNIGFSNEFGFKGLSFGFLISARLGGVVLSQTQAVLDQYGVSKRTADARDAGGIPVNTGTVPVENFYSVVGGDNPIWSEYVYSGTNVRLQEAHISYTFSRALLKKCELTLGITGNNLLLFYCKAPFDPESVASTGTYYQGFDYFMQPSLRSFGFNVNLTF